MSPWPTAKYDTHIWRPSVKVFTLAKSKLFSECDVAGYFMLGRTETLEHMKWGVMKSCSFSRWEQAGEGSCFQVGRVCATQTSRYWLYLYLENEIYLERNSFTVPFFRNNTKFCPNCVLFRANFPKNTYSFQFGRFDLWQIPTHQYT